MALLHTLPVETGAALRASAAPAPAPPERTRGSEPDQNMLMIWKSCVKVRGLRTPRANGALPNTPM